MDLTHVNLDSLYQIDNSSNTSHLHIQPQNKSKLGEFIFPVQIKIEDSGQTIIQDICLEIFEIRISEIEQVRFY
jgi:hypothetical protein